jgi:hypothetical protein
MAWLILALGCGTDPEPAAEQCGSGADEDLDGLVDCEDGDCFDACSTLTLELDEGWGVWRSESSRGFETRNGNSRLTMTDVTGHGTRVTPTSTLDCTWTVERLYMRARWAEYWEGSWESSMTGLDSTGGCGLPEQSFFGDAAMTGMNAEAAILFVDDKPWVMGTLSSSDSDYHRSSSGVYTSAWFEGQGALGPGSPWVRSGL